MSFPRFKNPGRRIVPLQTCPPWLLSWQYARDGEHVYYQGAVVKKADPESFIVLGQRYARDKKHLFLGDRLLEEGPDGFIIPEKDRQAESP